jgi:hypothetical protein
MAVHAAVSNRGAVERGYLVGRGNAPTATVTSQKDELPDTASGWVVPATAGRTDLRLELLSGSVSRPMLEAPWKVAS